MVKLGGKEIDNQPKLLQVLLQIQALKGPSHLRDSLSWHYDRTRDVIATITTRVNIRRWA